MKKTTKDEEVENETDTNSSSKSDRSNSNDSSDKPSPPSLSAHENKSNNLLPHLMPPNHQFNLQNPQFHLQY